MGALSSAFFCFIVFINCHLTLSLYDFESSNFNSKEADEDFINNLESAINENKVGHTSTFKNLNLYL